MEARLEERLGSADALKGSQDVQRERAEPIVIDVGQLALSLRPDELIRIEFRRVARKAVYIHAGMSLEKGPHVPTPMNLPAIPQQDEWSTQMAEQLAEERDDFGTGDVAHVEIKVQPEAVASRGHGQGRDDRDLLMPITMPKGRSVPDGRPGLAHVGNWKKSAFVEEREMRAPARGVFLTWAIRSASIGRWPPRRAGEHAVQASANSTADRAARAPRRRPGCSGRRIACGLLHRCAGESTARWCTRPRRRHGAAAPSAVPAAWRTSDRDVLGSDERAALSACPSGTLVPSGRPNSTMPRPTARPHDTASRPAGGRLPGAAASPTARPSLMVSCRRSE